MSTCRQIGPTGVPGPIAWTAIDRYAERYGYTAFDDVYDEFLFVITQMDTEFVGHMNRRAEANAAASSAK